jgi:hypothetical protein
MRLFFATDVHGSEICWKKFINAAKFYDVATLILGGDMTGKAIVPIIAQGGGKYKVTLLEQETILENQEQVDKMVQTIMNRGYYPYLTTPEEVAEISNTPGRSDQLFVEQVIKTAQRWMEYADAKLNGTGIQVYVCPGNDDIFEIDRVIEQSKTVRLVEGKLIQLDDQHEMISSGWVNPTPWQTHREESEDKLQARFEAVASQVRNPQTAIFNLHPPPYGSGLDEAPELTQDLRPAYAGRSLISVGSRATLHIIEKYQPLLGLHGHIHEGKGMRKYKRTTCFNAGSMYEQGILLGVVVELKKDKVANYIMTTG